MHKHFLAFIIFIAFILILSPPFEAAASSEVTRIPKDLAAGLEHLLSLTEQNSQLPFEPDLIENIFQWINNPKDLSILYSARPRNNASSIYYEFTINRSLKEMLDLVYNPDIPSYLAVPASTRRSKWLEINGKNQPLPRLSDFLGQLSSPIIVKGVEYTENTPDTHSGAYYAYLLDRTMILMEHKGCRVMLSLSCQRDKSNVGKKGLVLGADNDWNYLYTGEKGTTKKGLGWVDSYMYNSASVIVYYETAYPFPRVRCGVFKWIRAGWSGLNFVQPYHIRNGVERFARTFKEIVESPHLQKAPELSKMFRCIENLPTEHLKEQVRDYYDYLRSSYQGENRPFKKWFDRLFKDHHYVDSMKREELKAVVCLQYLKFLLGKSTRFDVTRIDPPKEPKITPDDNLS